MRITCALTDDEPLARKGLEGYIGKIDFLDLKAACEDALQLTNLLKVQAIDLLFLDIEMPYLSGIDFLKNTTNPPRVIFTTAYEQYAIKGYELDVLDYLLKPISFERFLRAANKAHDFFAAKQADSYMFVKSEGKLEKVIFSEILFAEAMENYVKLYLPGTRLVVHSTLKSIQDKLPARLFIQPHKSYLANINHIQTIEGNTLYIGGFQVPISKYQKEEVLEKIVNNKLLKK